MAPWGPEDARRHTKKADTPSKRRQFADVANSVLARTGDEGLAVREANGAVKKNRGGRPHRPHRSHEGPQHESHSYDWRKRHGKAWERKR